MILSSVAEHPIHCQHHDLQGKRADGSNTAAQSPRATAAALQELLTCEGLEKDPDLEVQQAYVSRQLQQRQAAQQQPGAAAASGAADDSGASRVSHEAPGSAAPAARRRRSAAAVAANDDAEPQQERDAAKSSRGRDQAPQHGRSRDQVSRRPAAEVRGCSCARPAAPLASLALQQLWCVGVTSHGSVDLRISAVHIRKPAHLQGSLQELAGQSAGSCRNLQELAARATLACWCCPWASSAHSDRRSALDQCGYAQYASDTCAASDCGSCRHLSKRTPRLLQTRMRRMASV